MQHNFYDSGDTDWIRFAGQSDATYQVDVTVPDNSIADVQLELFDRCDGNATPHDPLGPSIRIRFQPTSDGTIYLRLRDQNPQTNGVSATYHLSIQNLPDEPRPGALVIVGGRLRVRDNVQKHIYEATDRFYIVFLGQAYTDDHICYLSNDLDRDPDNNPQTPNVDALARRDRLEYAITQWATNPELDLGSERAFTLYIIDHGGYDTIYLNGRQDTVSSSDIDDWLDILKASAPGSKSTLFIDACLLGSFIDPRNSLSKEGRVVITSAGSRTNAWGFPSHGTVFSNLFSEAIRQGRSLYDTFLEAQILWVNLALQADCMAR